jgi:hypothetical protein
MFKSYYVNVQKLCLSIAKSYVCRSVEAMRVDVEKLCLMMSVRMFMYAYVYLHYFLRMFMHVYVYPPARACQGPPFNPSILYIFL